MRPSQVRITRKDSRMQIENFTLRYGNLNFKFSAEIRQISQRRARSRESWLSVRDVELC